MAEQSFKIYKDTAERLEKNASDIANLKEDYEGLSKDFDKLPLYVGTGSSCLMTDTGDYYKFNSELKEWKKTDSTTADIKQAVENYMKENPVEVSTDKTLSKL